MNINFLPDDIINYIGNYFLDSIQSKRKFKLSSKNNNTLINIPFNFTNKFISWCENINFNYQYINMKYLNLCDEMICKDNELIELWYSYNQKKKYSLKISPKKIKFGLMLPFSNMYLNTFKIYMEEDPKNWLWYHSIVKLTPINGDTLEILLQHWSSRND